jgi:hypothetical protein
VDNHKFVAFDVHAKTTTFVVLNDKGKVVAQGVTETTADGLTSLVKGISGKIHLTFEESTQAAWLHERLHRHVAKLVVCNPRKNRRRQENKNDRVDALQLARWLRSGDLSPVYHRDHGTKSLKELVRGYENVVDDRTRVKNRLKAMPPRTTRYCDGPRAPDRSMVGTWLAKPHSPFFAERARIGPQQTTNGVETRGITPLLGRLRDGPSDTQQWRLGCQNQRHRGWASCALDIPLHRRIPSLLRRTRRSEHSPADRRSEGVVTHPHQPVAVSQPPSLSKTPMATATDGC